MNQDQFEAYLQRATAELQAKQAELLARHGIGQHPRWHYEAVTSRIEFLEANEMPAVAAEVIVIGTQSPRSQTFRWAWANPSVLPWQRQQAQPLRELAALTGMSVFALDNAFELADDAMAWELAAVAVHQLGALGCYRAPSGGDGPVTYLAITRVLPAGAEQA